MTDRERVARALMARASPGTAWEDVSGATRDHFLGLADAALAAMPTWRRIPDEVREGEAPWQHILDMSLRMYPERGYRVGMRSGMMDAATVCDLLAKKMLEGKRPTKAKREAAALLTGAGDEIMRMRDGVDVPRDSAPIAPLPAPPAGEVE